MFIFPQLRLRLITSPFDDQNGKEFKLSGENFSMRFHLKEIWSNLTHLKVRNYINVKLRISEGQKERLKKVFESKSDTFTVHLKSADLKGVDVIAVTNHNRLTGAYEVNKALTIKK